MSARPERPSLIAEGAEESVLGTLLHDPRLLDKLEELTPDHFAVPMNRATFRALVKVRQVGRQPVLEDVVDVLVADAIDVFGDRTEIERRMVVLQASVEAERVGDLVALLSDRLDRRNIISTCSAQLEAARSLHPMDEIRVALRSAADRTSGRRNLIGLERLVDGADWLASGADRPDPLWGDTDRLLAVRLQPTVIAGAQGAGKTTIAGRLMLGALGVPGFETLLGLPVAPTEKRVLYLASDRPDQARLSLRRMVDPEDVRGRLVVWPGPPPSDIVRHPTMLLELAERAGASLVIVDSLKDIAMRLSEEETAASVNHAVQVLVASGIDAISLHHPRKLGGDESAGKPRRLDDLFGGTWLTSGAGSVLYLHPAGGHRVELAQFKTPNGNEVTIDFTHDPTSGDVRLAVRPSAQVRDILAEAPPEGISVMHIARVMTGAETPPDSARKRVERELEKLNEDGTAERVPGVHRKGAMWRLC